VPLQCFALSGGGTRQRPSFDVVYCGVSAEAPDSAPTLTADLNPEQRAAAEFGDGPLLIVAGAGTGKTRTLVYRVAHLIERGVRPDRILLLTFTRRAAREMLGRVEHLVGSTGSRVHGGTFHATAHRLLRAYGERAGIAKNFSILDQGDSEDLMGIARNALGFGERASRFPKKETLQFVYSRHVNTELSVEDILREELPQFVDDLPDIIKVFAAYTERKAERNLVDYDDLLLFWAGMLEQAPELGDRIAGLYDHVLVDEYQDTNSLQARVLRGMCRTHTNITVVGDDAQSIYAFRGANFKNILEFPKHFPGTTVVTLEHNYRSTQPILDVTNALIAKARERFTKSLWTDRRNGEAPMLVTAHDEAEQTRYVVDQVMALNEQGTPLREMAVLFRSGYMSADLEIELAARKIPFEKWGGLKFLEAAHVKDVLAFLRVLENPRDEVSWFRVLRLLPGIGEVSARGAMAWLADHAWDAGSLALWRPPPRAREAVEKLTTILAELSVPPSSGSRELAVEIARIRTMYDAILRDKYDRPEPRLSDLDQLESIAAGHPERAVFLAELALAPPSSTQDLAEGTTGEDDLLILSTAHSAKGCEWDAVFLIWAADGWFPSSRALRDEEEAEEERRLMYVAMTRARKALHVVFPVNVYSSRWGADYSMAQLSRFIDADVRKRMQRRSAGPATHPDARRPGETVSGRQIVDLRGMLRGRFGA
jgi:DNA helicase-2/ATP-dependent DNA helicase PcrA